MAIALDNLPDDPETLKAMIASMQSSQAALEAKVAVLHAANTDLQSSQTSLEAQVAALHAANIDRQARIDRQQLLLRTIQRATYGRSSEKLDESQYAFAFEEVQTALGDIEAQLERLEPKRPRSSCGRRALPAHL